MAVVTSSTQGPRVVIGSKKNFWLHSTKHGFDLTHPPTPESPPIEPCLQLLTASSPITIDPAKTALVVVDMQNFFLSPALGRPQDSNGLKACEALVKHAIPAARNAGIRIVWLNWGLTDEEIENMPPAVLKAFGFRPADDGQTANAAADSKKRIYKGLGSDLGNVVLEDGTTVDAGKLLMRDQWNSALYPPLDKMYEDGKGMNNGEDVWIHKNRMSGLWGEKTLATDFFDQHGIRTLLFTGVNTDQCVSGSLTDAFSNGYDCILLSDGCGTSSPDFAQDCIEFNSTKTWGFMVSCKDFADGVTAMR